MTNPDPGPALPALVLGSGITALGVLRILGREGIPTLSVPGVSGLQRRSRWYNPAPVPAPGGEWTSLADYLRTSGLAGGVLMPCSDSLVLETASLDPDLAERFVSCVPPVSALEVFINKGKFYKRLEEVEVPHPTTHQVEDLSDLEPLVGEEGRSYFIKPCESQSFFEEFGRKAMKPNTPGGFRDAAEKLREKDIAFLLQEYIPGPPSNHFLLDGFVAPGGEIVARLARKRLRMYPPDFGNSSLMISVPLSELGDAADHLERLLQSLDYQGIFSAEFKRDQRDGVLRLLEVNARPWWFIEFTARCGIDVATMAHRAALGETVEPVGSYEVGNRMIHPYYDIQACSNMFSPLPRAAGRFLRSLVGAQQPVFSFDDPLPGLATLWGGGRGFLRRRLSGSS